MIVNFPDRSITQERREAKRDCGTDCKKFTECGKLIGRPYDKAFMSKIKARLG